MRIYANTDSIPQANVYHVHHSPKRMTLEQTTKKFLGPKWGPLNMKNVQKHPLMVKILNIPNGK